MIALALAIAAADVPQSLLDEADATNLAYTQCAFAAERSAHEAGLSISAFEQKLASSCVAEERGLRAASARIFRARGNRDADAQAERLIRSSRQTMVDSFRRLPEQDRALEQLARMCREHPDACKH